MGSYVWWSLILAWDLNFQILCIISSATALISSDIHTYSIHGLRKSKHLIANMKRKLQKMKSDITGEMYETMIIMRYIYIIDAYNYCIPGNISVRVIIVDLARGMSRYFNQHATIQKLRSRAFQWYITSIYWYNTVMPYTVGKLLTSAFDLTLFYPAHYLL